MSTVFNVSSLFASWPAPKSNPWLERAPLGAHKQQFRAPAGRGDPRIGRGSGNRAQNAVSHEGVRQPITASCADGHDTGCTRRHFLENALLKRGPQSSRRTERDSGKGEPHVLPLSALPQQDG